MVGIRPKDFDIVTQAEPEDVQRIVRPSHIIGKRFRLVLARRYGQQYEIATFRSSAVHRDGNTDVIDENIYGEPKEDALRRDFTVNGLFYDPMNEDLIDFTQGREDIRQRLIRMIGNPLQRIEEDPIRILRALRLSYKISFSLDVALHQAIANNIELLENAILPRVREEILKILQLKQVESALWEAKDLGVLKILTPTLDQSLTQQDWAEDFFFFLHQGLSTLPKKPEPTDLFSIFAYSYLASRKSDWQKNPFYLPEAEESEFLRHELGMHKVEIEAFSQALNLLKQIRKRSTPQTLRPRHLQHLLNNRSLPLALKIGLSYHYLTKSEVMAWLTELDRRPKKRRKR